MCDIVLTLALAVVGSIGIGLDKFLFLAIREMARDFVSGCDDGVPTVLDLILRSTTEVSSNDRPLVSKLCLLFDENILFFRGPRCSLKIL